MAENARPAKRQRGAKAAAQATLAQAAELEASPDDLVGGQTPSAAQAQPAKAHRPRVLVDVHSNGPVPGASGASQAVDDVENEYERQRLERILANQQRLAELGVAEAAGGLAAAVATEGASTAAGGPRRPPRPRERRAAPAELPLPTRKSARQRGDRPLGRDEAVAAAVAELGAPGAAAAAAADPEGAGLLEQQAYLALVGVDTSGAVVSDGRFRGWVDPAVCARYGIQADPEAAWQAGGGGAFSFKIDKSAIPAALKGRGWSDARAFSHTQLQKNPNAYFYRHVAPDQQQAQGEWTAEEHAAFVATARAHGVGDKWGLFASYLPQRVGYQCSAYYRDVIIPQGLVLDRRFRMTRGGKAVYVG